MPTRIDLYTSRNLPFNLLPRPQWEVLRKHEIRFRPLHRRALTPFGAKGYFQLRIRWGIKDTWVVLEQSQLPLSNRKLAELILRGHRLRATVLRGLGAPPTKRSHKAPMETEDDKLRLKRYHRKTKTDSSDAGRARANTTLDAITARRAKTD